MADMLVRWQFLFLAMACQFEFCCEAHVDFECLNSPGENVFDGLKPLERAPVLARLIVHRHSHLTWLQLGDLFFRGTRFLRDRDLAVILRRASTEASTALLSYNTSHFGNLLCCSLL